MTSVRDPAAGRGEGAGVGGEGAGVGGEGAGVGGEGATHPGAVPGLGSTLALTVVFAGMLVGFASLTLSGLGRAFGSWLALGTGLGLLTLGLRTLRRTCRDG